MVESSKKNSNYFIVYLIEDAVQVWHFAHLIRKHSRQILLDNTEFASAEHGPITLLNLLKKRVDIACKHHLKLHQERETLIEMMEELLSGKSRAKEPIAIAQPLIREALNRKIKAQEEKPERGIALIRTLQRKIFELEERVAVLEGKSSGTSDAPLTTN